MTFSAFLSKKSQHKIHMKYTQTVNQICDFSFYIIEDQRSTRAKMYLMNLYFGLLYLGIMALLIHFVTG